MRPLEYNFCCTNFSYNWLFLINLTATIDSVFCNSEVIKTGKVNLYLGTSYGLQGMCRGVATHIFDLVIACIRVASFMSKLLFTPGDKSDSFDQGEVRLGVSRVRLVVLEKR
jgi:hypothetical protein